MPCENFNPKDEAKLVTPIIDRAGRNWDIEPSAYAKDVVEVSSELNKLSQGQLKATLAAIGNEEPWYVSASRVGPVQYDRDGSITGIVFRSVGYDYVPLYIAIGDDGKQCK